jgi:magnesium chelatase family protein
MHDDKPWFHRPFRSPHHSASPAALVGGGSKPRPGEISLAHGGVLFLDELPEFTRHTLEMLREPLESGEITLSRARHKISYPAQFQLVAAMNPCPCGYAGDTEKACRCGTDQIAKYRQRISGPLMERIDMHIPVSRVTPSALLNKNQDNEASDTVRARVLVARDVQLMRQGRTNAQLAHKELAGACLLGSREENYIKKAMESMKLSARSVHRSLRVGRTIADLAGEQRVSQEHLSEAFAYRNADLVLGK